MNECRGLPYGSGLGLSRCLGPGECLHSFIIIIINDHSFIHIINCTVSLTENRFKNGILLKVDSIDNNNNTVEGLSLMQSIPPNTANKQTQSIRSS